MMNERIRELAEQANAWYPMGYPSGEGGDAAWENLVIFEKEDLQKFAELIVRECMDLASAEQKRYAHISHRNMSECAVALGNFSLLIKDHFEVKE